MYYFLAAIAILSLAVIGAILYHIRGGGFTWIINPSGTQMARLVWAIPTGALVGGVAWSWEAVLFSIVLTFLGLMIPHSWCMRGDTTSLWGMPLVVCSRVLLSAVPAVYLGDVGALPWIPAVIVPGLSGLAYWADANVSQLHGQAECMTGALIWGGIGLTIVAIG